MIATVPSIAGWVAGGILSYGAYAYANRQESRFKAFNDPAFRDFMTQHGTRLEQVSEKIATFWKKGMANPFAFEREAWFFRSVETAIIATTTVGLSLAVAFVTGPIGWALTGVIAIWVLTPLVPRLALLLLTFTPYASLSSFVKKVDDGIAYVQPAPLAARDIIKASLSPSSTWAPYLFAIPLAVLGYAATLALGALTRTQLYKEQVEPRLNAYLPQSSPSQDDILELVEILHPIFEWEKLASEERESHYFLGLQASNSRAYFLANGKKFCTEATHADIHRALSSATSGVIEVNNLENSLTIS